MLEGEASPIVPVATALPFDRDTWTIEAVCNHAFAIWKRHWLPLSAVCLLSAIGVYSIGFLLGFINLFLSPDADGILITMAIMGIASLAQLLAQQWALLALQAIALHLVRTGQLDVSVGAHAIKRLPHAMVQGFLVQLPLVMLGSALTVGLLLYLMEGSAELTDPTSILLWLQSSSPEESSERDNENETRGC